MSIEFHIEPDATVWLAAVKGQDWSTILVSIHSTKEEAEAAVRKWWRGTGWQEFEIACVAPFNPRDAERLKDDAS